MSENNKRIRREITQILRSYEARFIELYIKYGDNTVELTFNELGIISITNEIKAKFNYVNKYQDINRDDYKMYLEGTHPLNMCDIIFSTRPREINSQRIFFTVKVISKENGITRSKIY